jgi:hypothetical protein
MVCLVMLPFRREPLLERQRLDWEDERAAAAAEPPEERVLLALELSEVARAVAEGAGAAWALAPSDDLADKAARYGRALRASTRP